MSKRSFVCPEAELYFNQVLAGLREVQRLLDGRMTKGAQARLASGLAVAPHVQGAAYFSLSGAIHRAPWITRPGPSMLLLHTLMDLLWKEALQRWGLEPQSKQEQQLQAWENHPARTAAEILAVVQRAELRWLEPSHPSLPALLPHVELPPLPPFDERTFFPLSLLAWPVTFPLMVE